MNLMNQIRYLTEIKGQTMFDDCEVPEPLVLDDVISNIVMKCGLLEPQYTEPAIMRAMVQMWFRTNQWNFRHLVNIILAEYSPIENTDRYSEHTIARSEDGSSSYTGTDVRATTDGGSDTRQNTLGGKDTEWRTVDEDIARNGSEGGEDTKTTSGQSATTGQTTDGGTDTSTTENEISAMNAATYSPSSKSVLGTQYGKTTNSQTTGTDSETETTEYGRTTADTETRDVAEQTTRGYGKTEHDVMTYGRTGREELTKGTREERSGSGTETYTEHTHGNIGVTTNTQLINEELALLKKFNVYDWIASKFERDLCIQIY